MFLKMLFPGADILIDAPRASYDINYIISRMVIVYGRPSSGKTETVRSIVERAVDFYGESNVDAILVENGDLEAAMEALGSSLVQIIFIDNFTLKEVSKQAIRDYFRIRHLWKERINRNYGYILTFLGLHRFYSTFPEFTTNIDAVIAKNTTMNRYDRSVLKGFIGEEGIADLYIIENMRLQNPDFREYSIFATSGDRGLLKLPLASKSYFRVVESKRRTPANNGSIRIPSSALRYLPIIDWANRGGE